MTGTSRFPTVWGHRGASSAKPENTVEAFREALRMGADGVELDVRRSADHALVIHHDAVLPDGRPIMDLEVADLPGSVPLLGAALDACEGMLVNIEIKNFSEDIDHDPDEFLAGAVVALVAERGEHDKVIVSSFSLDTINRVKQLDPDIPTGYLASPRWDPMRSLQRAIDAGHQAFHPHHVVVSEELVVAAHEAGVEVNVWTVDDPDRIRWLADVSVDAVITNVPDVAIAALRGD